MKFSKKYWTPPPPNNKKVLQNIYDTPKPPIHATISKIAWNYSLMFSLTLKKIFFFSVVKKLLKTTIMVITF